MECDVFRRFRSSEKSLSEDSEDNIATEYVALQTLREFYYGFRPDDIRDYNLTRRVLDFCRGLGLNVVEIDIVGRRRKEA